MSKVLLGYKLKFLDPKGIYLVTEADKKENHKKVKYLPKV